MRRGLHHMEGNGACLSDFLKIQKNICLEKCKVDEKIVPTFGHILKFLRFYFQFESRKIRFNSLQRTCFFFHFLDFFHSLPCQYNTKDQILFDTKEIHERKKSVYQSVNIHKLLQPTPFSRVRKEPRARRPTPDAATTPLRSRRKDDNSRDESPASSSGQQNPDRNRSSVSANTNNRKIEYGEGLRGEEW